MRRRKNLVAVVVTALAASSCGSSLKANYVKYDAAKKVAIVGVCQLEDNPAARGATSTRVNVGNDVVVALAKGFDQALPTVWSNVQVVTLAQVSANPTLPRREVFKRRRCAGDLDPFLAKGYTGDADKVYMAALAKHLGVDAVIAISSDIGLRFSGDTVRFMAGTLNPVYVHVVDKDGEQIAWASMKGLDSAEVPVAKEAHVAAGMSYGLVVAKEFVQRMANR